MVDYPPTDGGEEGVATTSVVSQIAFGETAEGVAGAAVVVSFSSLVVTDGATTASGLISSSDLLLFYYILSLLSEPTRPFDYITSNTLL